MRRLNPKTVREVPPPFQGIYAHAVLLNTPKKLLLVSGQIGVDPEGVTAPTFDGQVRQAMDNVEAILTAADLSPEQSSTPPAVTTLVISALAAPAGY